jgi:hypothetical protein
MVVESLCVVARGSEVQVQRCISFGCVVELFAGRCVCLVVLTGPVDPTLRFPANGIRLGLRFLDGGTHFCTDIYTDDHCLSHSVSLLVALACWSYIPPISNDARFHEYKIKKKLWDSLMYSAHRLYLLLENIGLNIV